MCARVEMICPPSYSFFFTSAILFSWRRQTSRPTRFRVFLLTRKIWNPSAEDDRESFLSPVFIFFKHFLLTWWTSIGQPIDRSDDFRVHLDVALWQYLFLFQWILYFFFGYCVLKRRNKRLANLFIAISLYQSTIPLAFDRLPVKSLPIEGERVT